MSWFAAHIVMAVHFKNRRQKTWPVWENIVLLQAQTDEQAFLEAEQHGRSEEGDDGGTMSWDGHPARWVFVGVRKVTNCIDGSKRPAHQTEITFSEFEFDSPQALERYVAGEAVTLRSADQFADAPAAPMEKPALAQRKQRA